MPTTVRRPACATSPVASSANTANVDDRRNARRNVSNTARHEAGRVSERSIGGYLEHPSESMNTPMLLHVQDPIT
jgi:hypothetical protein